MGLACRSSCLPEKSKSISPDVRNKILSPFKARKAENGCKNTEEFCRGETPSLDPLQGLKVKEHGLLKEQKTVVTQADVPVLAFQLLFRKKPSLTCDLFQRPHS